MVSLFSNSRRSVIQPYGAAALAVVAATLVRFALQPYVGNRMPFVVFYFAVIPVAWHLGVGPSLLAIVLATVSATKFFIPPFNEFGIAMISDAIGMVLFVAVNLVIVWFAEANRIARRRLEAEIQERVRAEATIREQVRQAEFGRDIGLALTSGPTLAAVLERCAALTTRHLGGDRARICTLAADDGPGQATADPAGASPTPDDAELPESLRRGLVGRIATERRSSLTNSLLDDSGSLDRDWVLRENMMALAGCPLVVEDRLVGVWVLFSKSRLTWATLAAMESAASSLALGVERKRADERRQAGEARQTAILQSSLDGIITMDHRGRVVEFNPAAEQIFGCSAASIQGQELAEVVMPQQFRPAHRRGLAHYLATGEGPILNRRIEILALRADGSEFPAELTVARIPIGGPPLFTAHIRDIGDRKQAEAALRSAKQEAEDASQAKDRFIAVLSHELRTPLNPISLTINSILSKTHEHDELRHDLELIRHYVGLEARLIDDLLDVMRIARGKMPLRWEVVDAHRLVEQAATACTQDIQDKSLALTVDLGADHQTIRADPNRICQVFRNLIKNAVKFTPVGGSITIRSRNEANRDSPPRNEPIRESSRRNEPIAAADAPLDPDAPRDDLVIEVSDTGIGIEREVLPRIFEAFQQGDSSVVRQFGGLGLGLAICNGVIEGHGGLLAAQSPGKGRGTTFTVRLRTLKPSDAQPTTTPPRSNQYSFGSARPIATHFPRPESIARRPLVAAATAAAGSSLQVLVVEDEPATIRLMSRLLRGLGYQVTAAETVAEANRHVDGAQRFDLIVSDIGLPDGTGFDLMRRVRATRGELPGIALTGFGTEEDIERSRLAGFSAHMTKPIDFTQLESLIRTVVGSGSPGL